MSMGEDLLILHLAIEGEEGYDPRILREYSKAVCDKLTYDISVGGHLHEKCKGFVPERATVAISRRAGMPGTGALPLLRHDHLRAMVWAKVMDSINIPFGTAEIGKRDELPRKWWMGYGSGAWADQFFNWAFVLKHVYPQDPVVDYFYKERLIRQGFGSPRPPTDARLPKPRIRYTWRELMLLTVTPGLCNEQGDPIDYDKDGLPEEVTAHTGAYVDMPRGIAMSRSSWDADAMQIHYECRSDVYMTGHETPEAGDFNLTSHGVVWSMRRDWYMDCFFRNMVLIDGRAGIYPNACGKLLEVRDNVHATTFVSDASNQYNWWQGGKNFYAWHGAFADSFQMAPWRSPELLGRLTEPAFLPHMRRLNEGLAGLDWGAWHGESRGPAVYHRLNDVDHVFRTLHMTKGDTPYVLIVDDVRKDDRVHQYDWCLHLERDIVLHEADSAVRNRFLPNLGEDPANRNATDLILTLKDVPETRYDRYGVKSHRKPKEGDPMLLVRVLWRNAGYPFPQPVFEEGRGGASLASRIRVPALAVDPEFRVLLFPHRFGDSLPVTRWNDDRTRLTVLIGDREDVYSFARTDRERTVFSMERDGQLVTCSDTGPAAPRLDTPHGHTPDRNHPDAPRTLVLTDGAAVALKPAPLGQLIRYTLDGADPTDRSPLYTGPIKAERDGTLKARTFARYWPFAAENRSEVLEVKLDVRALTSPLKAEPRSLGPGLACEVFEKHHTWFHKQTGIFTGRENMLPELERPLYVARVPGLTVPRVEPALPASEMAKGYYRYRGLLKVAGSGVHSFRIYSCGPVVLKVGGQHAINVTGTYGLSLKDRYGQAALEAGLHPFELIVCDPVFWKNGSDGPYPLRVAIMLPETSQYGPIAPAALSTDRLRLEPWTEPEPPATAAVRPGKVKPGLVMNCYDRTALATTIPGDGLRAEHMQIGDDEKPYLTRPVLSLETSDSARRLVEYKGYLVADQPGLYEFQTDKKGANELWIDGHLVARSRVQGPAGPGAIRLEAGHHAVSFRIAQSKPALRVRAPGRSEFAPAAIGMFVRPADAASGDDGRLLLHLADSLDNRAGKAAAHLRKGKLVDRRTGKAFKIAGADSRLEVTGLRTPEDALSLAFWIRVDKHEDRGLVDNSSGSHPGARLRHYTIWAGYYRGSPNAAFDLRKVGADKGRWCHVAITWGPTVCLYVNGQLRDRVVKEVPARNAHVTDLTLFRDLDATFDDIRIYNKVLTAGEIAALHAKDRLE
jgi:hypothetical protein